MGPSLELTFFFHFLIYVLCGDLVLHVIFYSIHHHHHYHWHDSPLWNYSPFFPIVGPSGCSFKFLNYLIFTVWGCEPHVQPPTWRTRASLFVWLLPLDLSNLGGPTSSYATAGIALRVSGAFKLHHHNKGGGDSTGGGYILLLLCSQLIAGTL
jgi:hypothetical protein